MEETMIMTLFKKSGQMDRRVELTDGLDDLHEPFHFSSFYYLKKKNKVYAFTLKYFS